MTLRISSADRRKVRERAGKKCEYCRKPEETSLYSHHVDHIIAPIQSAFAVGKTSFGRVTVRILQINHPDQITARQLLIKMALIDDGIKSDAH